MGLKISGAKMFRTVLIVGVLLTMGYVFAASKGMVPGRTIVQAIIPSGGEMSSLEPISVPSMTKELPLPSSSTTSKGTNVNYLGMAWNSQAPLHYANGGPKTTKGSLMEKYGVNLTFTRQDDTGKMREDLLKFATAYAERLKAGDAKANPGEGTHFFGIMGSGAAAMAEALSEPMAKLGLHTEIIAGSPGKSKGEDKYLGKPEWKKNPQLARGSFVSVYPMDGDQDIIFLWARQNKIPVNCDARFFDQDAINIFEVKDFVVAGEKYIAGAQETRPEIKDGKTTGKKVTKTVDSVSSWTPVDVDVVTKKGGLVTLASTKDYAWQMPCVIFGVREWNENHRNVVEGMLSAMFEGSDQIRKFPAALHFAAQVSAETYKAENADYWETYYKGRSVRDSYGNEVELGGSASMNLAENLYMFGMLPDQRENIYATTYTMFGKMQSQMYPNLLPKFPTIESVLNTSYLQSVAQKNVEASKGTSRVDVVQYDKSGSINDVIAKGVWQSITFNTGSASFNGQSMAVLRDLLDELKVSEGYIEIHGHTDSVGGADQNMELSQRRADAVKNYLAQNAPGLFQNLRIKAIAHGQESPVANNATDEGRAQNRRVEIILGQKRG